jgi:hypothetical protein
MIASNYRKHPEALALQLPLPFPHRLVWALPRPGARILRAIRVARAKAFDAAGRIAYPVVRAVPAWWTTAKKQARQLARQVKAACLALWAEVRVALATADTELIGFNYEDELARLEATYQPEIDAAKRAGNRYRARTLNRQYIREIEQLSQKKAKHATTCTCTRFAWLKEGEHLWPCGMWHR